jgi:hypothetical protein
LAVNILQDLTPDPVTPDPVTPDPATPDPATPDPVTPVPGAASSVTINFSIMTLLVFVCKYFY